MNQNCMITREAALEFGLSFQNTYTERPFRDQNWQVVRARENKKIFLWIYERNGYVNLNVKADPKWRDFWRSAYESVQAGYHQNKEHWNTIILNGTVPDKDIKRMISESYDLVTYSPTKKIYEAVKQIPKGCVATYGQVAAISRSSAFLASSFSSAAISLAFSAYLFARRTIPSQTRTMER